jgi:preprotein translocase subunit SecB
MTNKESNVKTIEKIFVPEKIYIKNSSCEIKGAPNLFKEFGKPEYKPENKLEIKIDAQKLAEDNYYEVILQIKLSVTLKHEDTSKDIDAILVSVSQAGIFHVKGFDDTQLKHIINVACPDILYPYARHVIAELIVMADLPPVHIVPVNFALMQQKAESEKSKVGEKI